MLPTGYPVPLIPNASGDQAQAPERIEAVAVVAEPACRPPSPALAVLDPSDVVIRGTPPTWLDRDLAAAREVQRALLPPLEQHWRGVEIVAAYRPAHQVGGDFFEVVPRARGRLTAVVGDVAGKGVAAALVMARVSGEFRRVARRGLRPGRMLAAVNRWLDEQDLCERFVTAGCVSLDLERAVWTVASAGHPAALLFRRNGAMETLAEGGPGLGLGCVERWRCDEREVPARPGDTLLLMTDGLTDRLDPSDIAAAIEHATTDADGSPAISLRDLRRDLIDRVTTMPGPRDDVTLLSLRLATALPDCC
jgi:phosphoserine phosphatase RsbU/P